MNTFNILSLPIMNSLALVPEEHTVFKSRSIESSWCSVRK